MSFTVTYSIITPESAEDGEAAEMGYALPGGWHDAIEVAMKQPEGTYDLRLREAAEWCGGPFIDCGSWFDVADVREDYRTGEVTSYSLHPPKGITPSSYRRLARLLGTEKAPFESRVRQFMEDNADGHY
jgi:hypothetical protein